MRGLSTVMFITEASDFICFKHLKAISCLANFVRNTQDPTVGRDFFVRGKMEASSLKGEMQGKFNGTLNGKISSDGNRLTGSYNITTPDVDKGIWQAQKK